MAILLQSAPPPHTVIASIIFATRENCIQFSRSEFASERENVFFLSLQFSRSKFARVTMIRALVLERLSQESGVTPRDWNWNHKPTSLPIENSDQKHLRKNHLNNIKMKKTIIILLLLMLIKSTKQEDQQRIPISWKP